MSVTRTKLWALVQRFLGWRRNMLFPYMVRVAKGFWGWVSIFRWHQGKYWTMEAVYSVP